ncbi:MAG: ComF family protein [Planctomycetaceae bacterium]|jgi:ComF family protein|nr:ComF family protein [Planctomycetaceae bacterium]
MLSLTGRKNSIAQNNITAEEISEFNIFNRIVTIFLCMFFLFSVTDILNIFFPPLCPICGTFMPAGWSSVFRRGLFGWSPLLPCVNCVSLLVTPEKYICPRCGGVRKRFDFDKPDCNRCRNLIFKFRRAIVLGEYEGELRSIVLRMKTDKSGFYARTLSALLLRDRSKFLDGLFDLVVPVPIHRKRRWWRGVNSPDLIANEISRGLQIPVSLDAIKRTKETTLQFHLSDQARLQNVTGAFAINPKRMKLLKGKRILLIDDILTTGATCNEISKLLKKAGAKNITVCAIARAVGNIDNEKTPTTK